MVLWACYILSNEGSEVIKQSWKVDFVCKEAKKGGSHPLIHMNTSAPPHLFGHLFCTAYVLRPTNNGVGKEKSLYAGWPIKEKG